MCSHEEHHGRGSQSRSIRSTRGSAWLVARTPLDSAHPNAYQRVWSTRWCDFPAALQLFHVRSVPAAHKRTWRLRHAVGRIARKKCCSLFTGLAKSAAGDLATSNRLDKNVRPRPCKRVHHICPRSADLPWLVPVTFRNGKHPIAGSRSVGISFPTPSHSVRSRQNPSEYAWVAVACIQKREV
jgi:hypothetical protein